VTGPHPRGKLTDEELANLRLDASAAVKDIVGPGYVPGFYQNEAGSIVGLVEHWVDRVEQRIHDDWMDRLLQVGREWPDQLPPEENMATPQKVTAPRLTINERIDAIIQGMTKMDERVEAVEDQQKVIDHLNDAADADHRVIEALTVRIEEQSSMIRKLERHRSQLREDIASLMPRLIALERNYIIGGDVAQYADQVSIRLTKAANTVSEMSKASPISNDIQEALRNQLKDIVRVLNRMEQLLLSTQHHR
jgi:hypothetical protein